MLTLAFHMIFDSLPNKERFIRLWNVVERVAYHKMLIEMVTLNLTRLTNKQHQRIKIAKTPNFIVFFSLTPHFIIHASNIPKAKGRMQHIYDHSSQRVYQIKQTMIRRQTLKQYKRCCKKAMYWMEIVFFFFKKNY